MHNLATASGPAATSLEHKPDLNGLVTETKVNS